MSRSLGADGRSVERLDSWSEVTLGLCCSCCVSVGLILGCFFLFELSVLPWVHSWEGPAPNTTTTITTTTLSTSTLSTSMLSSSQEEIPQDAKDRLASKGFKDFDKDGSSDVDSNEFAQGASTMSPPMDSNQANSAFDKMDSSPKDSKVSQSEWDSALAGAKPIEASQPSTTGTTGSSSTTGEPGTGAILVSKEDPLAHVWARINRTTLHRVRQSCDFMALEKEGEKHMEVDEFEVFVELKFDISEQEGKDLFRVMDLNHDGRLSKAECKLHECQNKKMLKDLGTPDVIVQTLDSDGNGKLDQKEFAAVGDMLFMDDDRPFGKTRAGQWFYRLDKDGNDLTMDELNFTVDPGCSAEATPSPPPPGQAPVGAPAAPPTLSPAASGGKHTGQPQQAHNSASQESPKLATNSAAARSAGGSPVTQEVLNHYRDVPATMQCRTSMSMTVPAGITIPSDDAIGQAVWSIFSSAFRKTMECGELRLDSRNVVRQSEADGAVTEDGSTMKLVTFRWEIDPQDGGTLQEKIMKDAAAFSTLFDNDLKTSGEAWLLRAQMSYFTHITAEYYGMKALHLPRGISIEQEMGEADGHSLDGSSPYTISETGEKAATQRLLHGIVV